MSIVVASVPGGHVYVRHLSPPEPDTHPSAGADEGQTASPTVVRLPDPRRG